MSQNIIFTCLPWKDYTKNKWMLSAAVSIQLDANGGATLAAYPDILHWMDRLQGALFYIQWNNDKPVETAVTTANWDPTLYQNLFQPGIIVKPFTIPDLSKMVIKSYPAGHLRDFILNTYQEVGNLKPDTLPTAGFYVNDYKKLADVSRVQLLQTPAAAGKRAADKRSAAGARNATAANPVQLRDLVSTGHPGTVQARQLITRNKVIAWSPQPNPSLDFGQFYHYFGGPYDTGSQQPNAGAQLPPPPAKPVFDYHSVLSVILDYPIIQRKLGLVLDFELPGPPSAASGFVRIIPTGLAFENELTLSTPPTAYQLTATGFYAASKTGSSIDKGNLAINNPAFSIVQIDTEGSVMKLANHSDNMIFSVARSASISTASATASPAASSPSPADTSTGEGLPTLRSAGIGIIRNGLADQLLSKLNRLDGIRKNLLKPTTSLNNTVLLNHLATATPQPPATTRREQLQAVVLNPRNIPLPPDTLYADDLVKGYRIDIAYDNTPGTWYSLHRRMNTYNLVPLNGSPQPITLTSDQQTDEGCIQLSLTQDANDPSGAQQLNEVMARWEGWSLSVPRPGKAVNNTGDPVSSDADEQKKYQLDPSVPFRLGVNTAPAPKTLPMLRFGRSYSLKIRTVDLGGNSLPAQQDPEDKTPCVLSGIRYLRYEPLPTPILRATNELAGGSQGQGGSQSQNIPPERDGESLELMVIRSNYNLASTQYEQGNPTTVYSNNQPGNTLTWLAQAVRHILAPPASQLLVETHGIFDAAFSDPAQASAFYSLISSRDKPTVNSSSNTLATVYPVDQQQVDIDWLADPMAAGVILTMQSLTSFETGWQKGASRKFSFYFNEEVTDSNAGTPITVDQWKTPRSFRIILAEGSTPPEWNAGSRSLTIYLPKSAQVTINYACFWRPDDLSLSSGMNACVNGTALVSAAAARTTPVNAAGQLAKKGLHWMLSPWRTLRLVHAVQQPLQPPLMNKIASVVSRNYGDTFIHINTRLEVNGSSTDKIDVAANWTEWIDDLSATAPQQVSNTTHVDTISLDYTDKILDCAFVGRINGNGPPLRPPIYQAFGDTKHRTIDYTPVATTRYREYFTGLIEAATQKKVPFSLTRTGSPVTLNILSSARPVLPAIEYLLPSFNWATTVKGNTTTHIRTGNIRVYVRRPWYSSGDNERLAVILCPKGSNPAGSPSLTNHCTVWGMDPVFVGAELNNSNFPNADNFPYAADYDSVRLAEDNNTVAISAYAVNYDPDKQLYFSDIPLAIGAAYFPLVKLSLARYQRDSLRLSGLDCCLSKMVSTDWMQVVPPRQTGLTISPGKSNFSLTLSGTAPFGAGNSRTVAAENNPPRTRIRIRVEDDSIPKSEDAIVTISSPNPSTSIWEKDFDIGADDIKAGQIQFSTTVKLDKQWSGKPYRIIISEYELHPFDPLRTVTLHLRNQPASAPPTVWSERLVFMDIFEVNGSI